MYIEHLLRHISKKSPIRKTKHIYGTQGEFYKCSPITQSTADCYYVLAISFFSCFGLSSIYITESSHLVPGFWQPHWHLWCLHARCTKSSLAIYHRLCLSHHYLLGSIGEWWPRALQLIPLCNSQAYQGRSWTGAERELREQGTSPLWVLKIMGPFVCREFRTITKLAKIGLLFSITCPGD